MTKKIILSALLAGTVIIGSSWVYFRHPGLVQTAGHDIRLLDIKRDTDFIKQQNYDNWYLLHASPEYDLDFMLQTSSPYAWEPRTYGKLTTVILFDNNEPAGFVNYYMRGSSEGTVFLLSVDKKFRGKGFGETLLRHAVEGLKKQGAKFIKLSVREENEPAQKLYKKVGFYLESSDNHGFHFYRLDC